MRATRVITMERTSCRGETGSIPGRHCSFLGWLLSSLLVLAASAQAPPVGSFARSFAAPPDDCRPMMRWWWFGPAVVDSELSRELHVMQGAGIGAVEIQPVYPLSLDDPSLGIKNLPYLSPEFLAAVHYADSTARSLGMRVDITLGSGWPYGGPGTTLALSAGRLKLAALPVTATSSGSSMPLPSPAAGDALLAAFSVPGTPQHWTAEGAKQLLLGPGSNTVTVSGSAQRPLTLLLFYSSHTLQQVKRPAVGAEGLVIDHFARAAIDEHLHDVADKLSAAFGSQPPYSVFSDSLEVYGSDWTPSFPAEFLRRRGYDIIPHLPELYAGGTPEASSVRNDWGRTLSDLIRENYLTPINEWAQSHHTLFRSQTYGDPAVTLADEAVPALPEGEGPQWRQFSFTRWASSASHLYHRNVTSAETFTWLHSPVFMATPLDMKVEADRMFLSGVNQIVGHGWPYTPPGVAEPGWSLYAAAVFNDHNPWFPIMPDVAQYLQRGSWLLRQGDPANEVAILLPEDDAQASFTPGNVSVTDEMRKRITPELMRAILDAGYNLDYIDAATIEDLGDVPYPVMILPPTERLPLATARLLSAYVEHGGHIIATGTTPTLAPGLERRQDSPAVAREVRRLFANPNAASLATLHDLADALRRALPPDLSASNRPDPAKSGNDPNAGLGFIHRVVHAPDEFDIYFVVNSSSDPLSTSLSFRAKRSYVTEFSLDSGKALRYMIGNTAEAVTFAPYESRVFVLSDGPLTSEIEPAVLTSERSLPSIRNGWTITFPDAAPQALPSFIAWNTLPGRTFFSGEAVYTREFQLNTAPAAGEHVFLDFGEGTPGADTRRPGSAGIRALLDSPIRDAAIVFVNGKRAGSIWHPPYSIDIGRLLENGGNKIEVHVYNTAVNLLAGEHPRDYAALNAHYGKRFDPQDMNQIRSLPSGLLFAPALRHEREASPTRTGSSVRTP